MLCASPGPHAGAVWECPVLARSLPLLHGGSSTGSVSSSSGGGDRGVKGEPCGGDAEGEEQLCAFFCVSPGFCGPIYWLGRYSDTREQQPDSATAAAAAAGATQSNGPTGTRDLLQHTGGSVDRCSGDSGGLSGGAGGGGCPGEWAGGASSPDCPCFHMEAASGPHLLDLGDTIYAPNLLALPPPEGCQQREQQEEQVC